MGLPIVLVALFSVWVFHVDPLIVLVLGVLAYHYLRQRTLQSAADVLEYWKAREFDLKQQIKEAKEDEKERRMRIREARATRRRKTVRISKEMRLLEKVFKEEDRTNLTLLTPEARAEYCKTIGLNPEVVEAWIKLSQAELQKKKLGIEDEDDLD